MDTFLRQMTIALITLNVAILLFRSQPMQRVLHQFGGHICSSHPGRFGTSPQHVGRFILETQYAYQPTGK
jgi:hypothetical protein